MWERRRTNKKKPHWEKEINTNEVVRILLTQIMRSTIIIKKFHFHFNRHNINFVAFRFNKFISVRLSLLLLLFFPYIYLLFVRAFIKLLWHLAPIVSPLTVHLCLLFFSLSNINCVVRFFCETVCLVCVPLMHLQ